MSEQLKQALEAAIEGINARHSASQEIYSKLEFDDVMGADLSPEDQAKAQYEEAYSHGLLDALFDLRRHLAPLGFLNPLDSLSKASE